MYEEWSIHATLTSNEVEYVSGLGVAVAIQDQQHQNKSVSL
jgi:hypothetical protein